jgi:hypothetical protein
VAVLAPLPYSLWRLIWAVGIPLGIHPDGLHDFIQSPGWGSLGLLGLVLLSEGTAVYTYVFVLSGRRTLPGRLRRWTVPPWLIVLPLLAPIGILTTFNHWSLQYVFDGFSVPPEVAEGFSWASFWLQVLIFWVWGVSLTRDRDLRGAGLARTTWATPERGLSSTGDTGHNVRFVKLPE